ncbi:MAG: flagellar basal body-associated FliL family protein [Lachnospiraceae bacterium]|nr:flagellar basal body-associated FliL family protein [Lachnospiraceae bacterium]
MKKNMISILILALLVVNIVLTAIMMFSVVGTARKTSALIDDITSAINLELDNQRGTSTEATVIDVPIENIEVYKIEEELTIPLTIGADGKSHYFLVGVALSLNTKDSDYKKLKDTIADREELIKGEIISVIGSYTVEELQEGTDGARMEVLSRIQKLFGSEFIFNVTFTKSLPQ